MSKINKKLLLLSKIFKILKPLMILMKNNIQKVMKQYRKKIMIMCKSLNKTKSNQR